MDKERIYDVMLSYASENRRYVEEVYKSLEFFGIDVFYDESHTNEIWGQYIYSFFENLVSKKSKYIIIFISKYYTEKVNTTVELKAAIKRQMRLIDKRFILPIRMDHSNIDIIDDIGYLDSSKYSPYEISEQIYEIIKGIKYHKDGITINRICENLEEKFKSQGYSCDFTADKSLIIYNVDRSYSVQFIFGGQTFSSNKISVYEMSNTSILKKQVLICEIIIYGSTIKLVSLDINIKNSLNITLYEIYNIVIKRLG